MDTLAPIFERIKLKEKKYAGKTLVGLIDVSSDEYASLEKKALEIMVSYKHHPYINQAQSDILSVYAILFDMYEYTGERFWESLAIRSGLDEKYVRDIIIEAMKTTYESRCWGFYQTTRNEYVETIRMHGIIGNDSSGDKIIYALYVIWLKDFEKEVTNEKLDFFFPYLRNLFRKYEGSVEEDAANYDLNGIAYIRGQLPKSFMRAFLLSPSAVATELKHIFDYFKYMETNKNEPIAINERFENKIKASFKRNHNFVNEYTSAHIRKKAKQLPHKDKIEYKPNAVRLHVPTHFLDFQSNEDHKVVLKVFNYQHMLKTVQLNISVGGIGWKSETVDLTLAGKYKNVRYTLEKQKTKEIIYDSQQELYEKKVQELMQAKLKESSPIEAKKAERVPIEPKVFTLLTNGAKVETDFNKLKPGYIYEISPANGFKVDKADYIVSKDSLMLLAMNRTEISDGQMKYNVPGHKQMIVFDRDQHIHGMTVNIDDTSTSILTGIIRIEIVMGFPYALNELQLKVNEVTYDGLSIRKKLLKEIKLMDNGDFVYVMEISEGLRKQDINRLQAFINIKGIQLKYVQHHFYFDPNWSFSYQCVQFQDKEYIQINDVSQLDGSKEITNLYDKKVSVFLKRQGKPMHTILNVGHSKKDKRNLLIQELEKAYLYDPDAKRTVTETDKKQIIDRLHDDWNESIKQLMNDFVKDTSTLIIINQLMNDYLSFRDTFSGCLLEVDDNFIDKILTGLSNALFEGKTMKSAHKKYIPGLIRILASHQMDHASREYISKAMRLYQMPIDDEKVYLDINHALYYQTKDSTAEDDATVVKVLDDISPEQQILSLKLYRLASNSTMSELDTILEVRSLQTDYPEKDAMTYYELIATFKHFISGKQFAKSSADIRLFMNVFYQFAIEYNKETVCEFMNELEKVIDKNTNEKENLIIRKRLMLLAKALNLDVLIKNECNL